MCVNARPRLSSQSTALSSAAVGVSSLSASSRDFEVGPVKPPKMSCCSVTPDILRAAHGTAGWMSRSLALATMDLCHMIYFVVV